MRRLFLTQYYSGYACLLGAGLVAICVAQGCTSQSPRQESAVLTDKQQVAAVPLVGRRMYVYKTDILPSGDMMKRWHWDAAWEVRSVDGSVLRRMYSPDWSPENQKNDGPRITVIQDPLRGTIYEVFFVQQTNAVFSLPVTLHFFATRESPTPLFSLSLTDSTAKQCQEGRLSRGGIHTPGISRSLFESAEWVGIGWQGATYERC
jgi:hypothetical protein